jgi:hypothetical protein
MSENSFNTNPTTSLNFGDEKALLLFFEGTEAEVELDFNPDTSKIGGTKLFDFRKGIKDGIKKGFNDTFPLKLDTIQDEEVGFKEIVDNLASEFKHVKFQTEVIDKSVVIDFNLEGTIFAKNKKFERTNPFVDKVQVDRENTKFGVLEVGSEAALEKYFSGVDPSFIKSPVGLFGKSGGVVSANKLADQVSGVVDIPLFVSLDYVDTPEYLNAIDEVIAENALEKGLNNILKGKKIADLKGFDFSTQKDKAFDTSTEDPEDRLKHIIDFFEAYSPQKKLDSNIGKAINYYQKEADFDPYSAFITNKLQGVRDIENAENVDVEAKYESSVVSQLLTHGNIDNLSVVQESIKKNIDDYIFSELDFDPSGLLNLNGKAVNNRGNLELTPNSKNSVGGAFLSKPIPISTDTSFSSQFTFFLDNPVTPIGADGISFVVQNDPRGINALGMAGGSLGYFGSEDLGIANSLAVYFDTFENIGDPSDNFIGIGINGKETLSSIPITSVPLNFLDFNSNVLITSWVDYDGAKDMLSVFLSRGSQKPENPVLRQTVDLPALVGDEAFFGFTGATGGSSQTQSIYSWSFHLPSTDEVILNFNEDAFGRRLSAGEIVDDEYSALGLSISSIRRNSVGIGIGSSRGNPMIFDSENPTGGDLDLKTSNQGHVLIVSEDDDPSDPDDNGTGGIFRFDWDEPVSIEKIGLLDIDTNESVRVITVDADNNRIDEHRISKGAGNNQLQDLIIDDDGVYGMVVQLSGSGAITDVIFAPDASAPQNRPALAKQADNLISANTASDLLVGLYDADNDTLIGFIEEGDTLLASELAGREVTIAAFVDNSSVFSGQVESVFLNLNDGQITRVENVEPYALFGDTNQNYVGGSLPQGDNTLVFELYSDNQLKGDLLATVNRSFTIVNDLG